VSNRFSRFSGEYVVSRYQLAPYKEFAKPYYADMDSAHDFAHIERILDWLGTLSKETRQPPRLDHLYFLACFHGLEKRLNTDHGFREQVTSFLHGLAWTKTEVEEILLSLSRHFTDPKTVEEEIIHDANYIELLGAFGIAKAFTTGGARGQTIEQSAEIFEHQFLKRIKFRTPIGKRLAEGGRTYARRFLKRLRAECSKAGI
jgi:uncharacterized protein